MDPFMMRILVEKIRLASEMGIAIPGMAGVDSLIPRALGALLKEKAAWPCG